MSRAAVIIVTHNSTPVIDQAVIAIEKQTLPPHELIIVDSGSTDTRYLDRYTHHTVIKETNLGFAGANNRGVAAVGEKVSYLFFINPDCFLTPTYLEEAVAYMDSHPRCAAMQGLLLGFDVEQDAASGLIDSAGISRTWYGKWYDRYQGQEVSSVFVEPGEISAVCGAAFCLRWEALKWSSQVFDTSFFMYKEDIELSRRLASHRFGLDFVPQIRAYHCRGWQKKRSAQPKRLRLLSARNELVLHFRLRSFVPLLYSLGKYLSVKFLNV